MKKVGKQGNIIQNERQLCIIMRCWVFSGQDWWLHYLEGQRIMFNLPYSLVIRSLLSFLVALVGVRQVGLSVWSSKGIKNANIEVCLFKYSPTRPHLQLCPVSHPPGSWLMHPPDLHWWWVATLVQFEYRGLLLWGVLQSSHKFRCVWLL